MSLFFTAINAPEQFLFVVYLRGDWGENGIFLERASAEEEHDGAL